MTDDDIRAELAELVPEDCQISRIGAYRAGMRRAAQIARDELLPNTDHDWGASHNMGVRAAAAAIERAAGGEG